MQQMYNIFFTKRNKQKRPTKASDYGRRHNGMAESTVTADSKLTSSDTRRRIWAIVGASSGNLVEWFDFYVYSFCSLYFAHIFFPSGNTTTQLLQTAGVFAAGFLMRLRALSCPPLPLWTTNGTQVANSSAYNVFINRRKHYDKCTKTRSY